MYSSYSALRPISALENGLSRAKSDSSARTPVASPSVLALSSASTVASTSTLTPSSSSEALISCPSGSATVSVESAIARVTVSVRRSRSCPATLIWPSVTPGAALSEKYQRAVNRPATASTSSAPMTLSVMIHGSLVFRGFSSSPGRAMASSPMVIGDASPTGGMATVRSSSIGEKPSI